MKTLIKFGSALALKEADSYAFAGWLLQFDKVDVDGEFFTGQTDFGPSRKEAGNEFDLPLLYRHGMNPTLKATPIGTLHVTRKEEGFWADGEIDRAAPYASEIRQMVKEGKLGLSSGALGHAVAYEPAPPALKDGKRQIKQWFKGEGSLTPNPAEPSNVAAIKSAEDLLTQTDPLDATIKEKAAIKENYWLFSILDGLWIVERALSLPAMLVNDNNIAKALRKLADLLDAGIRDIYKDGKWDTDREAALMGVFKEAFGVGDLAELKALFGDAPAGKGGKRNSSGDQAFLDVIHDTAVKAGASCNGGKPMSKKETPLAQELAALKEDNAQLTAQLDTERALRADAETQVADLTRIYHA